MITTKSCKEFLKSSRGKCVDYIESEGTTTDRLKNYGQMPVKTCKEQLDKNGQTKQC